MKQRSEQRKELLGNSFLSSRDHAGSDTDYNTILHVKYINLTALVSHRIRVFRLIPKLVLRAVNSWEVARTFLDWFHRKSRRRRRPGFEIRESCPDPRSANQAQRVLRNAVMDENDIE